jgi:hypothetical protein
MTALARTSVALPLDGRSAAEVLRDAVRSILGEGAQHKYRRRRPVLITSLMPLR